MSLFRSKRQVRRRRARDRANRQARAVAPLQVQGLKGRLLEALTATRTQRGSFLANVLADSRRAIQQERLEAIALITRLFGLTSSEADILVDRFIAQHNTSFRRLYELVSAGAARLRPPGVLEWMSPPARMIAPRVIELRAETRRSDGYHSRETRYLLPDGSERIVHEEGFLGNLREVLGEERRGEISAGYETRMPPFRNHIAMIGVSQPKPCVGCRNYHGQTYGGNFLVCGIHASGWDGETCPDWEGADEKPHPGYGCGRPFNPYR